jgi:hypothetical protein
LAVSTAVAVAVCCCLTVFSCLTAAAVQYRYSVSLCGWVFTDCGCFKGGMRFSENVSSLETWPPRSPDLTPPNFHLCGAAKPAVCCDRPRSVNELKTAITAYIKTSDRQICRKFWGITLKSFRPLQTLVNIFCNCTATFRTQMSIKYL